MSGKRQNGENPGFINDLSLCVQRLDVKMFDQAGAVMVKSRPLSAWEDLLLAESDTICDMGDDHPEQIDVVIISSGVDLARWFSIKK